VLAARGLHVDHPRAAVARAVALARALGVREEALPVAAAAVAIALGTLLAQHAAVSHVHVGGVLQHVPVGALPLASEQASERKRRRETERERGGGRERERG